MSRYSAFSDDFYVNVSLNTEMDLPTSRETLLHYFEQCRSSFPRCVTSITETGRITFWRRTRNGGIIAGLRWNRGGSAPGTSIRHPSMKLSDAAPDGDGDRPVCPLHQPAGLRIAERHVRLRLSSTAATTTS